MSPATATKNTSKKKAAAAAPAGAAPAAPLVGTLTIARSALVEALAPLVPIASKRTTLPVLTTVLVEVEGDGLQLTVTDLDQAIRTRCAAGGAAALAGLRTAIPAKQLAEVAKAMPAGTMIVLQIEPGRCMVTGGRAKFAIPTLGAEEFPQLPPIDGPEILSLPAKELAAGMQRVEFAASRLDSRPIVNSVLLDGAADGLHLVGFDGHRLARTRLSESSPFEGEYIIPIGTVPHLTRLFGDDERVIMRGTAERLLVQGEARSIETRLLEGPYPVYRQLLAKQPTLSVVADRAVFLAALRRVALALEGHHVLVELTIPANEDETTTEIQLHAESDFAGRADDVVPCRIALGSIAADAPFRIGFNVHYLIDALGFFAGEKAEDEVALGFTAASELGFVSTVDEAARAPSERAAQVLIASLRLRD